MTPQVSESRDLDKVIVRLPHGMRDELKSLAARNNRSMNAEIVALLESGLTTQKVLREKLEAIAAGTFVPDQRPLDIFDAEGFDPAELNKSMREMRAQLASLRRTVEEYTTIWKFDPNGEPDQEEAKERVRDFVRALAIADARRDRETDVTGGGKE